ncbi:MAG: glutathione S-transferase family protein [Janthinobacterium lividum]
MKLVIGNKNYSSWSMRPWILLKHFEIPFREIRIPLYEEASAQQIRAQSPSGKLPCLIDEENGWSIWDSLAICETLAERFPQHQMWPSDPTQRAHARSIAAEMHAGFGALRNNMSMNLRASLAGRGRTPEVFADIARIDEIWTDCAARYDGPFLFGEFGIADAMFVPVVMRFNIYHVELSAPAAAYATRINDLASVKQWIAEAVEETEVIPRFELYP